MKRAEMRERLERARDTLADTSVPIRLLQQIGIPIMNVIDTLQGCIADMPAEEAKQEAEADV